MDTDERAIRTLIASWHQATAAGDIPAVLALIDEGAVFLVAGQPPMRGRHAFEAGLRGLLAGHRVESAGEVQDVHVSGDLATSWTVLHVRVLARDTGAVTMERAGSALSVYARRNGVWRLVRDANLLAAVGRVPADGGNRRDISPPRCE